MFPIFGGYNPIKIPFIQGLAPGFDGLWSSKTISSNQEQFKNKRL